MTGLALLLALGAAPQDDPKGIEFFEKKIRPILAASCYECHSGRSKKLKGGLLLDSRDGLIKGGNQGPALVPGDIEKSLLVRAVRWVDEDLQMPPKQKLPESQIADLVAWVKMGAPDPRGGKVAAPVRKAGMSIAEGKNFWAYRPTVKAPLPEVRDAAWPKTDLDRFILARLEGQGLRPAPPAERSVLLRRVHYDLIGLPPSPEEVDAFVNDKASDAYERVVDRLLASPHYGERWGRHWLDVARFAESLTLRGFIMKEAWRYRDYVIETFNADVPYDRFVREQVAGDLLPGSLAERRRQLVGASFLTFGNTNLEEQDKKQLEMDVVDEQLEAVGRAFLAQTIGCARCHDHKFDPIPTRDYYALAGIFKSARALEHANVSKWIEAPLPDEPEREAEVKKHEQAVAALEARIKAERTKGAAVAKGQPEKPKGVLAIADVPGLVIDDAKAEKVGDWQASTHSGTYIGTGYLHDKNAMKGEKSLTFHPDLAAGKYEVRVAYSHGTGRATNVPVIILSAEGEKTVTINQQDEPPIEGRYVSLGQYRFENNQGYVIISNENTQGHVTADAVVFLPADKVEAAKPATADAGAKPSKDAPDSVKKLEAELKKLQESGPRRDLVMTVREEKKPVDLRVHHRGSVHNLGETVPRGFLQVAATGASPTLPPDQSGRRQLADWMAGPQNPLTARVFVNRAWHWLFGAGLVRTPDNFGTTGETPSHPELLDFLAVRFVEERTSVKKLVREIVLSSAYRMASAGPGKGAEVDPDNRLLWRMNRRRLDAEAIRDTLLRVSGQLKTDGGGPTFPASMSSDYGYKHADLRRSVYVPAFRNALPDVFEVFDFADTSVVTGRRDVSTVAPQALFFMNNPFVLEQARHAAERLLGEKHEDDRSRAVRAYRMAVGRPPTGAESEIALRYVGKGKEAKQAWAGLFHALFASIDFRYVN